MFSFFHNKAPAAGIDLVENSRFSSFKANQEHPFLQKVFSPEELSYCFSYSDPVPHLSGTFAAKEAVSKALGVSKYPFAEVLIIRDSQGKPDAFHKGKKLPLSLSISHTDTHACAIAVGVVL